MFTKNSRYHDLETVTGHDRRGRRVQAVKLRRLPVTGGEPFVVRESDQLDVMSEERYRDATRFWHVGDANSDLEINELVRTTGQIIRIPRT